MSANPGHKPVASDAPDVDPVVRVGSSEQLEQIAGGQRACISPRFGKETSATALEGGSFVFATKVPWDAAKTP